jgi:hypothetical protein
LIKNIDESAVLATPTILHVVYILAGRQLGQDSTSQCHLGSISKSKNGRWLGIDRKKELDRTRCGNISLLIRIAGLAEQSAQEQLMYDGAIIALSKAAGSAICEPGLISQSLRATFSWNFLDG